MRNSLNEKNNLNEQITYEGEVIISVLQELNYILCSLHDMGSYYLNNNSQEYEKETTHFNILTTTLQLFSWLDNIISKSLKILLFLTHMV